MNCNYLKIDFDRVKGYQKLSVKGKKLFGGTYKRHNACLGQAKKYDESPKEVKEKKSCIEVILQNNDRVYYYPDYTWG